MGSAGPDLGRPIVAPLEQCATPLGVDLATVGEVAANIEPSVRGRNQDLESAAA